MPVDQTDLEIRVKSLEVAVADKRLNDLEKSSNKAEKATSGLTKTFTQLAAAVISVNTLISVGQKLVDVQRNFDILNSGLITATKSAENAAIAFDALREFAQNTPYDLNQAVDGFNKLVNFGLTPSERALMSYGNTASAMGKDLSQMIEAVADAATAEFERLKEFGIKAKNNGDTVTFTFQGVKETVKNNAAEIEQYLIKLGENQFAGAMAERMKTLDGAIANLEDNWETLFRELNKSGFAEVAQEGVEGLNDVVQELIDLLASGEMEKYLEATGIAWSGWASDLTETISILSSFFNESFTGWGDESEIAGIRMSLGLKEFPAEVRAYMQEAALEVITRFETMRLQAVHFKDSIKAIFTDDTWEDATARYDLGMQANAMAYQQGLSVIRQDKDETINAVNEKIEAGKKLREEYQKQLEARAAATGDRLAGFRVGGDGGGGGSTGPSDKEKKEAERKQKALAKEFEDLKEHLQTEEESIQASYEKRRKIIESNTTAESDTRRDLMARLEKDRQKELDDLRNVEQAYEKRIRLAKEVAQIEQSGWNDAQKAAYEYQQQIETLWQAQQAGAIGQKEHEDLVNQVTKAYENQQDKAAEGYFDLEELGKQAARNTQDAFADFLFDPFQDGLDGMLLGFVNVVRRMAAEAAAAQLSKALFGGAGSGDSGWGLLGTLAGVAGSFFGGGSGGALSSVATSGAAAGATSVSNGLGMDLGNVGVSFPGRASGGPTVGGQMYEVAERGPELYRKGNRTFLIDGEGGNISPMTAGSSDGGVNLNLTLNVYNDGTVTESRAADNGDEANSLMQSVKSAAIQVVRDEMRQGGLIWSMTEGRNG